MERNYKTPNKVEKTEEDSDPECTFSPNINAKSKKYAKNVDLYARAMKRKADMDARMQSK